MKMKSKILLSLAICSFCLPGCSDDKGDGTEQTKKEEAFKIKTASDFYDLDIKEKILVEIDLENSYFHTTNKDSVSYSLIDNNCGGNLTTENGKRYFSASKEGTCKIAATCGTLVSQNEITIESGFGKQTYISELNKIKMGMPFGHTFNIKLPKTKHFKIETYNANDVKDPENSILEINEDNEIEVVGVGMGSAKLYEGSQLIIETVYTVYRSTFVQRVVDSLLNVDVIKNENEPVYKTMFPEVKNLDLSEIIVNYPDAAYALKYFTEVETLNLSNNNITDADLSELSIPENHKKLIHLDLSNNDITDASKFFSAAVNMNKTIKTINLANNQISEVDMLGSLMNVEVIDLRNNKVNSLQSFSSCMNLKELYLDNNLLETKDYADAFSSMKELKVLHISNCGLNDIALQSIRNLPVIEDLGLSSTDVSLSLVSSLSSLKKLYLSDCNLSAKTLGELNKLTNLEFLDISSNNLSSESFNKTSVEDTTNNLLDGNALSKINELHIGNNEFDDFSFLSTFKSLKTLDLSWSYNLTTIKPLQGLDLVFLNIDNCNSLLLTDYVETLDSFEHLTKLSALGCFNYIDETTYNYLLGKLSNNLILRITDEDSWITSETIKNYKYKIYFNFTDFIASGVTESDDGKKTLKYTEPYKEVIVILHKESKDEALKSVFDTNYVFNIPLTISKFTIFGNSYYSQNNGYKFNFFVENRNESSVTLEIHDLMIKSNSTILKSEKTGSKVNLKTYGKCEFRINEYSSNAAKNEAGLDGIAAIDLYDLNIWNKDLVNSNDFVIKSSSGQNASTSSNKKAGKSGGRGADGIISNSCYIYTGHIKVEAGNGGDGARGGDNDNFIQIGEKGYRGGDGGRGGSAIVYKKAVRVGAATLIAGNGGLGGRGGDCTNLSIAGHRGDSGNNGASGSKTERIS